MPDSLPYKDDLDVYLVDEWDPNFKFDNEAAEMESEEYEEDEEDELYLEDAEGEDDEEHWMPNYLHLLCFSFHLHRFQQTY